MPRSLLSQKRFITSSCSYKKINIFIEYFNVDCSAYIILSLNSLEYYHIFVSFINSHMWSIVKSALQNQN